ncbi:hypothetical protein CBS101457_002847 [Exobasidium rhododendri]|nr:hypothetical protein CBS101457_002847 [Exobasidium rhododendri]
MADQYTTTSTKDAIPRTNGAAVHIPPAFAPSVSSATTSNCKDESAVKAVQRPQMRGLSLTRTHSRREVYDADTASTYGEFGSYSSGVKVEEEKDQTKRTSSRPRSSSRDSGSKGNPSSRGANFKPAAAHHGFAEEAHDYVHEDAREKAEEEEILRDVERGHSGESVREKQSHDHAHAHNVDLEKQQEQQQKSNSDTSSSATRRPSEISTSSAEEEEKRDPNLVTWDSPSSQENPRNWSLHRRWSVIVIVSTYTFLSPLSSSMIAPALPTISAQFHITSSVLESLMLSVFVLAYAVGPLFLAPLSEMFGRRIVLQSANAFFIIFTVACAVAQDRVQLSIFRFFAGLGGSAPLTIGGGTVSDLMLPEERGVAMSIYSLGPLMGPALGPIIGGWIIQRTGNWRWIFGVACIAAGITASIGLFILPETYAPKILGDKAKRLRKETGNEKLHTVFDQNAMTWQARMRHNMVRPFILIATQPIIIVLGFYLMITYGCMYLVLTSFASVFQGVYNESVGIASLNYLSLALGFTLGGQICGRFNDHNYKRLKALNNGVGQPEFKLPVMMATAWMPAAGLLIYGWSAQYHVQWIVPNIGAAILAFGMIATFQCVQTYTVDTYNLYAASALSANTFLRSLAGFALPLASGSLYSNLGYGWGNTVLGLISAVVGIPAPFLLYKYGAKIRAKSQYASD